MGTSPYSSFVPSEEPWHVNIFVGGGGRGGEISGMGTSPYFSFVLNHGTSIFLLGRGEREEKQVRDNLIFMFRPILY